MRDAIQDKDFKIFQRADKTRNKIPTLSKFYITYYIRGREVGDVVGRMNNGHGGQMILTGPSRAPPG